MFTHSYFFFLNDKQKKLHFVQSDGHRFYKHAYEISLLATMKCYLSYLLNSLTNDFVKHSQKILQKYGSCAEVIL